MKKRLLCMLLCLATLLPLSACRDENLNELPFPEDTLESIFDSETTPPVEESDPKPIADIKDTVIYLFEGKSKKIRYTMNANNVPDADAKDIEWTVSTDCVSVKNGVVTAEKQGYAYVSGGGDTRCLIQVLPQEMPKLSIDTGGVPVLRDDSDVDRYIDCTVSLNAESNRAFNLTEEVAGIRVRGNSTARAEKKPYRLKFASKLNLLGMNAGAECKNWVLLSDPYDDSMIRNTAALSLASLVIDEFSADWRYVRLELNGEDKGVYVLTEQSQIDENRINIEEAGADTSDVMSGYLFEMDASPPHTGKTIISYEDLVIREYTGKIFTRSTNDIGTRELHMMIENNGLSAEQKAFAEKYLQNIFTILYSATMEEVFYEFDENYDLKRVYNTNSKEILSKVFDIDSLIRMYIHSELVCNGDQSKKSFYLYVDFSENGTGLCTFGCPWDFDSAFCGYKSYTFQKIEYIFAAKRNLWYVMIMNCTWFREEVCKVWKEVYEESDGFYNVQTMMTWITEYYADDIAEDAAMWGRTKDHTKYCNRTREWIRDHVEWLNKQFDPANEESVFMYP